MDISAYFFMHAHLNIVIADAIAKSREVILRF